MFNQRVVKRAFASIVFTSLILAAAIPLSAQTKVIQLRNGALTNGVSAPQPRLNSVIGQPVSGMFLVQFSGPVQPAWRTELAGQGVTLLRYIPDDTFIARFRDVVPDLVRANPYVHWVGEYKPEYKVFKPVLEQLRARQDQQPIRIRMMLSPDATLQERADIYKRLAQVKGLSRNRFGDVLEGAVAPQQLNAVLGSPAVFWLEGPANMKLSDEISTKIVAGGYVGLGAPHQSDVQVAGYDGYGVTVSVADSGLNNGDPFTMHPDLAGRVVDFFYYGDLFDAADEHAHGTHVTGIIAGDGSGSELDERGALYGMGVAPRASIVAQRIFDGIGGYEPPESFEQLTRDAVRAGADIGSNSWGDDSRGRYDISAAEFDALVRDADFEDPGDQPYILEFSAGNAGPVAGSINSPAVAKNVIATGASQNDRADFFIYADGVEAMADFSSRGPCEDGRIKPDIVAPGTWIASAQSASASSENAWLEISPLYQYQGGTSQAGPHASGAAAVFVQWYREQYEGRTPSPAMVKAALINSAWDMDDASGTVATPNNDEGWGRVDLPNLILGYQRYEFIDQTEHLTTGQVYERRAVVLNSFTPLIITLTYTDVPGMPSSIPALVNDLDLEIISPTGKVYRGNQFDNFGLSFPGATAADRLNNVEGIYIDEPVAGEWLIRVVAHNVVEDAVVATSEVDQDFALVISGDLPLPDDSVLLMDRTAYRAPSEIKLKLIDYDRSGDTSMSVSLTSSTEPAGFNVVLNNTGIPGSFTGTVATATAPAVAGDGKLQIADGDLIRARYYDESQDSYTVATAIGDFQPPPFQTLYLTNRFGRTFVVVGSNELVDAKVFYGTNTPPTQTSESLVTRFDQEVELKKLVYGRTYYVAIQLTDIAGNVSVYDNNGNYLQFLALPPAEVLLVNAYTEDPPESESTPIPLTEYTQALAQTGVNFDVWEVGDFGSPTLDALLPYKVVIWRLNDSLWSSDTLNANQQATIRNYINSGGGFFISSMELISRMGDVPFRRDVLQVDGFITNPDPFGEPCDDCDEDFRVPFIVGEDYDPISGGVSAALDYSKYPVLDFEVLVLGPDFSDTFTPSTNAASIFYEINDKTCGIRYPRTGEDSPGRIVFLSFPVDAIPMDGTSSGRVAVMGNILRFLAPGLNGLGSIAFDNFEYTVPDQVIVEVADTDLEGQGTVDVTFYSSLAPGGVVATLNETVRPGLFRGSISLVDAGTPAGPGKLRTGEGDTISCQYLDESTGLFRSTYATIDTIPPTISNLMVEPSYTETFMDWETDEYTDALVQFSDAPLFSGQIHRTAHNPRFTTSHALTLNGLRPDTLYYYRVISRDIAGNAVTVSTTPGGAPLTFRTLKPLMPPWSDDMENPGLYDWDLFSADESESVWELGSPAAYAGMTAHSGGLVWGSNVGGKVVGYVESFLISPPIDLTGGNRATLKFWQNYDFQDFSDTIVIEFGQLLLITNTTTAPITLADYFGDSTFGWDEQEFDLSPHIGKVVYAVWYYAYFTIENERRRGWMIDDVSVTMEQIEPASLFITNNLAQATFNISGPINRSAQPWFFSDTNAPPGEYIVSFNAVPHYLTPSRTTNYLDSGDTLNLMGNYTMVDSNGNGIADSWEQQYFGGVNPNHGAQLDSDGDGMADSLEFLVGTNPTNAASVLNLSMPAMSSNNVIQIQWPTVKGRAYQLQSSANLVDWKTLVDWYRSTGAVGDHQLVAPTNAPALFRLRAQP